MEDIYSLQKHNFKQTDYEDWKVEAQKTLKETPLDSLFTNTYEDITLHPIYTRKNLDKQDHIDQMPGFDLYLRGVETLGNVQKPWLISQEIDVVDLEEFNRILRNDLANGQTMINFSLKQTGDNKGLAITSVADMKLAFNEIPLSTTPVYIDAGCCSLSVVSLLQAYFTDSSHSISSLTGTVGMDPLATLVEDGQLTIPIETLFETMKLVVDWSKESAPQIRPILVKSEPYHNGGASAVGELAFTIATGAEYLHQCTNRGIGVNDVAPNMTFAFSVGSNLFMEMAKLRAARILWSTVVGAYGGNQDAKKMHVHARTSALTKTVYDPYVNILRGTTEAFAAAIGGVESLHVARFDELIKPSNSFSRRIARNTQLILQEESHLNRVIDPVGGSWYVESLTTELVNKAWEIFQQVEANGGMLQALKKGFVQDEVKKVVTKRKLQTRTRQKKIVGTNMYVNLAEQQITSTPTTTAHKLKSNFTKETKTMKIDKNTISSLSEKLYAGASTEVCIEALQEDNDLKVEAITHVRVAEEFEMLRKASDEYLKEKGERPQIGLISLGPVPEHKKRADFAIEFLKAGGFEAIPITAESNESVIQKAKTQTLLSYVFCGSDQSYQSAVGEVAKALITDNPELSLFLVGKQELTVEETYKSAGIKEILTGHSNCFEILSTLQRAMGVR